MSERESTQEERILVMMKKVLSSVARDTAPRPGLRQPLSETTIQDIRECLMMITAREQELGRAPGRDTTQSGYIEGADSEVVIPLDIASRKKGSKRQDD